MELTEEELGAAFGRFLALIQERARAGLAHPDRSGADRALADIDRAATEFIDRLFEDDIDPVFGRCDTCGSRCDEHGCMADRAHVVAIDPTNPGIPCRLCPYLAIDRADHAEHHRLNHLGGTP